jgi:hypothetical protein
MLAKEASGGFQFGSFRLAGHLHVEGARHALSKSTDLLAPIHTTPLVFQPCSSILEVFMTQT